MTSPLHLAIVGAGVTGLLQALTLLRSGFRVSLFERAACTKASSPSASPSASQCPPQGCHHLASFFGKSNPLPSHAPSSGEILDHHCSFVGAGMLAPYCELGEAEDVIAHAGEQAFTLWQALIPTLSQPAHMSSQGTLLVAHHADRAGMHHLAERIKQAGFGEHLRWLRRDDIKAFEPEIADRFHEALFVSPEGELDPRRLLPALLATLREEGATLHFQSEVEDMTADGSLVVKGERLVFDAILDCRGLGARKDLSSLRGVRGELAILHSREIQLQRPIRMMHPRYPLYIVPRPDGFFVVGATSIESDSLRQPTVRSVLELLSAAYSLHPAFAEAEVVEMKAHLRPTLPDHLPRILHHNRLLRINGLYRHGFLLSPFFAHATASFFKEKTWPDAIKPFLQSAAS